ncbi:PREDICTED: uncharacterized protein LOC108554482 isoform X2 [Eufriesea mexicana]|uniref:uncharacterized protein LOC108554482 isoform X2 n=1 Tax=Eufriesea mexicana TaxID=516756 RepID=UPI00083BE4D8|nr:PREDICTED: uncharacterized protein LOC108554482 isoform X2 [Eufriesea mexicana]XP_017765274.1 PREDICTED: uncharacterized protein LOC108554482 isoform X2 [Eufriesea mexicana]
MYRRDINQLQRFDFDDTTFSPPSHDDSFFYLRYPKSQNRLSVSQDFRPIDEVFDEQSIASSTNKVKAQDTQQIIEERNKNQEIDFSKYPLPCQPFVPTTSTTSKDTEIKSSSKISLTDNTKAARSQGIDDGFHRKPALCGKSIVLVASQMMSNKFHENFSAEQAGNQPKKGSKSLPATPLTSPASSPNTSPKARRRVPPNRYFTGPLLPDREKYQGGWILSSIFGQSREIVTGKINEEDETNTEVSAVPPRALTRKKSISSQNLTYIGSDEKSVDKSAVYSNVFQAKPSELREMNFWFPTSM